MNHLQSLLPRRIRNRVVAKDVFSSRISPDDLNIEATRELAIFPKLKVAFNRVQKNGNSTSIALMHAMETGRTPKVQMAKRNTMHYRHAPKEILSDLKNYSFIVIVRNPYSRVLSAFLSKFKQKGYIKRYRAYDLDAVGFLEFLKWLEKDGLSKDSHWDFQRKRMIGPPSSFDHVLRFEEFPLCLTKLLTKQQAKLPQSSRELLSTTGLSFRTGSNQLLSQLYTSHSIEIVQSLFKKDFELLEYPIDFESAIEQKT